jgi:hypothetical protein
MSDQQHEGVPYLIEGKLTDLHWELGSENLLAKVDKHYKDSAAITGAGVAVGDMFGQVANAAMLAMYDGEDTQNFMCLIDDKVACGQFGGAEQLPEGGRIKAVVSRQNGVLYVHAAMDQAREIVWINHPWGMRAEMWANLKLALFAFFVANISFATFWLIGGKGSLWETIQFSLAGGGALALIMAIWANRDLKALAGASTEYFRLLGFENPESVNLNFPYHSAARREYERKGEKIPDSWFYMSECQYRNVYSVKEAIAAGKAKLVSPKQDGA